MARPEPGAEPSGDFHPDEHEYWHLGSGFQFVHAPCATVLTELAGGMTHAQLDALAAAHTCPGPDQSADQAVKEAPDAC
jgi:hypothetical protein